MRKSSREVSNIKGLSRTVCGGYQPKENSPIDPGKLPTSGSNAVKPEYISEPGVSAKYNPCTKIIELEQELAFKNGQIKELQATIDRLTLLLISLLEATYDNRS